jgi:hypothetical protein
MIGIATVISIKVIMSYMAILVLGKDKAQLDAKTEKLKRSIAYLRGSAI